HSGGAISALQRALRNERLLQRMQALALGQCIDGFDTGASKVDRQQETGGRGAAIDQDGASAAHPDAIAGASHTRQPKVMSQKIKYRPGDIDRRAHIDAVERKDHIAGGIDPGRSRHGPVTRLLACAMASAAARRTSTPATRVLYRALHR